MIALSRINDLLPMVMPFLSPLSVVPYQAADWSMNRGYPLVKLDVSQYDGVRRDEIGLHDIRFLAIDCDSSQRGDN